MPEAKLAREAELPYALLALATDYDCWHETEEDVSVEAVLAVLKANATLARRALAELAGAAPRPHRQPRLRCTGFGAHHLARSHPASGARAPRLARR